MGIRRSSDAAFVGYVSETKSPKRRICICRSSLEIADALLGKTLLATEFGDTADFGWGVLHHALEGDIERRTLADIDDGVLVARLGIVLVLAVGLLQLSSFLGGF